MNGGNNTAAGVNALSSNTIGSDNTASGAYALVSNTTGYNNTATGAGALIWNSTGGKNTANGSNALGSNTTGWDNTATGHGALLQNSTGGDNTANGTHALQANKTGNFNTASGHVSLYSNTIGSYNTADGFGALHGNSSGTGNLAIKAKALLNNATGSSNIGLGYYAGGKLIYGSDNIYIGNPGGAANEANTTRIGSAQTRAFAAGIRGVTTGLANAVAVVIDGNGQLGTVNSSARFKQDISDMAGYSTGLFDLRPVTYRYKEQTTEGNRPREPGLIAEEVAEIYPDLVTYGSDGQIETVQYHKLTPMLLNELQRQQRMVKAQAEQLAKQAQKNTALETEIRDLKASLADARAETRLLSAALAEHNERLAALETVSATVDFAPRNDASSRPEHGEIASRASEWFPAR